MPAEGYGAGSASSELMESPSSEYDGLKDVFGAARPSTLKDQQSGQGKAERTSLNLMSVAFLDSVGKKT